MASQAPRGLDLFEGMRQTEADVGWAYWVVVYGFASDDAAAVMTVRSFMAFGEVVESHQGTVSMRDRDRLTAQTSTISYEKLILVW